MAYKVQDHYFHKAKRDRYLARAVYKFQEFQKKYRLLKPGMKVLDLGAAPGSWSQYAAEITGPKGRVVAVDLKPMEAGFPDHVTVLQRDITAPEFAEELVNDFGKFDAVISDLAPSTTGVRVADSARSAELFERALELAERVLKPQGHFVAKIFQGSEFHELLKGVKHKFGWVKSLKPEASRKQSKEIYILAMRFKKP
jgi:23S rRNA (uridine2552-2'-O)-methyltransferase